MGMSIPDEVRYQLLVTLSGETDYDLEKPRDAARQLYGFLEALEDEELVRSDKNTLAIVDECLNSLRKILEHKKYREAFIAVGLVALAGKATREKWLQMVHLEFEIRTKRGSGDPTEKDVEQYIELLTSVREGCAKELEAVQARIAVGTDD